ncbi:hypothetical protein NBRC116583_39320 [Arenicella sp. 4NH20-0111]|uniref:hypothetical protein n=1 Tax=Arenicella sp. 4NH20-0111 TaxID=3127648 RepID=UPI003108BE9F
MKTIITIVSLLLSATAFAESDYVVKTEVLKEQSSLGSPTVVLESGVSSQVSVEGSYSLSLTVSPAGEKNAFLKTQLEVGEESHSPSMMVELDKETKVTINDNTTLIVTVKKA